MVPTEGGNGHRQPLLHVGYAKTGSTWLQKSVFGRTDGPFLLLPLLDALELFVFRDDAETAPGRIAAELAGFRARADAADAVPVVSHEVLVGDQTQGRYWGHQVARRLQAVFPDARVLMVIREQTAMLVSSYRQHLHVGGTETLAAFFSRQPGFEATCRPDFLAYDRMIAFYQELFGRDRVCVLPFELLGADPAEFARRVTGFAGARTASAPSPSVEHPGFGAATLLVRRRLNRLAGGWTYADGPEPPAGWRRADRLSVLLDRLIPTRVQTARKRDLARQAAALVGDRFAASNRLTRDLTGLDLAALGYRTAD